MLFSIMLFDQALMVEETYSKLTEERYREQSSETFHNGDAAQNHQLAAAGINDWFSCYSAVRESMQTLRFSCCVRA
jgi:hypothetical protein